MIPHVVKGADMNGLIGYLCSTSAPRDVRANQHSDPHVVGGDPFVQAWWGVETLDQGAAEELAAYLDEPRRVYGTEIRAKVWQQAEDGRRVPVLDEDGRQGWRDEHVWHCSLSLADGETLSAEQWQQVTREFADGMGLTEAGGHAPARWVAIHHGPGKGGHDHVHIAASMVREDGTRWEGRFRDFPRSQQVCRELEQRHGLVAVEGRDHGTAMQGPSPAARRRGDQEELAHRVRSAAVASSSEAEWLRQLHADGVAIKPRFAAGSTDVVVGYRVSLGKTGDQWHFYGGGTLGHDLTLPRVRECWPAPSLEQAQAASDEWQRAFRGRQPAGAPARPAPTAKDAITALQSYELRLRSVPAGDRVAWSHAARDVSGALSAWSRVDPDHAAQLRQAAQVIARTAQDRRPGLSTRSISTLAPALMFLAAERKPNTATKGALAAALIDLAGAFATWHQTSARLVEAQRLTAARAQLEQTRTRMSTGTPSAETQRATAQRMRSAWGTPARGPRLASPLPTVLQPPTRTPQPSRGREIDGR